MKWHEFGVIISEIMFISNVIEICPKVLQLKHVYRRTYTSFGERKNTHCIAVTSFSLF